MKIYIIDDNIAFLNKIETELKKLGYFNFKIFNLSQDNMEYIINHPPEVVIFKDFSLDKEIIDELRNKNKNIVFITIIPEKEKDFCKYFNLGISAYLKDNYSLEELKVKLMLINNFISSIKKVKRENEKLKKQLEYKNIQEELAIVKQKKFLKNELFMFFENEHLLENYISSKDVLSGDALFSKRINENEYVLCIVDAMGKGLNAALTSITTTVFLEYSIKKSLELNDFNFKRSVRDFFNYAKAVLLNNESLCAILVYINNDKLHYANFGMPPIYTPSEKYRSNNPPIMKNSNNFNVDVIDLPDKFFILSDGLIESRLKNNQTIYFSRFLQKLDVDFLKELLQDFEDYAYQDDDISIIHYKKDTINNKIFEINAIIKDKKSIDDVLKNIPKNLVNYEKIIYILQELLMNTLEHALYNLKMKKEYLEIDDVMENGCIRDCIKININFYNQNGYTKIEYKEKSEGFDINILKDLYDAKYHGKGIKIIKFISDGVFFNYKGNEIKIFLKDK